MTQKRSGVDLTVAQMQKLPADKWEQMADATSKGNLTWESCMADDLQAAIVAATEDGAAVLLSKTSDGGALVLQVWNGAGRHKLYPASLEELVAALNMMIEIARD